VVARAYNEVETKLDASAHAELQALREAARRVGNWRLLNATLYCTLEPCPMCLSAAYAFRVGRVVYAAPDRRLGAVTSWLRLPEETHPFHHVDIDGGLLEDEAAGLLTDFFKRRRRDNCEMNH